MPSSHSAAPDWPLRAPLGILTGPPLTALDRVWIGPVRSPRGPFGVVSRARRLTLSEVASNPANGPGPRGVVAAVRGNTHRPPVGAVVHVMVEWPCRHAIVVGHPRRGLDVATGAPGGLIVLEGLRRDRLRSRGTWHPSHPYPRISPRSVRPPAYP